MPRQEFSTSVRLAAWKRCDGRCEKCTAKLYPGKFAFDHVLADGLGGLPTLQNCEVLCTACHAEKTHGSDRPMMAKADRGLKKHLGIRPRSRFQSAGFRKAPPQHTASTPPQKRVGNFPEEEPTS